MNELIKIVERNGQKVVSARELHQFLEVKNHFTQWFDDNKNQFDENIDYQAVKVFLTHENGVGGTYKTDYALTLECAKELSMMSRVEKGRQVRQYFIACENKLKEISIPQTYAQALLEAGRLALEVENKNKQIEVMKPKADFFDQVTGSKDCFDMVDVAKVCNLGVGRNTIFKFLRETKILRENNTPYQQYVDCGYFRVIESKFNKPDGTVCINLKTVVYQKGIDFIIKRFVGRNLNK